MVHNDTRLGYGGMKPRPETTNMNKKKPTETGNENRNWILKHITLSMCKRRKMKRKRVTLKILTWGKWRPASLEDDRFSRKSKGTCYWLWWRQREIWNFSGFSRSFLCPDFPFSLPKIFSKSPSCSQLFSLPPFSRFSLARLLEIFPCRSLVSSLQQPSTPLWFLLFF